MICFLFAAHFFFFSADKEQKSYTGHRYSKRVTFNYGTIYWGKMAPFTEKNKLNVEIEGNDTIDPVLFH